MIRLERLVLLVLCLLSTNLVASWTHAQFGCKNPNWLSGFPYPGVNGGIEDAVLWDKNGPGGEGPVVVLGGSFPAAGDKIANNIITYNPDSGEWQTLGEGFDDDVLALAVLPDGTLVAGGSFIQSGSTVVSHISKWDGSEWIPIGNGFDDDVHALAVLHGGELIAGGMFSSSGNVVTEMIARWNGSGWQPMNIGSTGQVDDLTVLSDGRLLASGRFIEMNRTRTGPVASWDGQNWSQLIPGLSSGRILSTAEMPNGDVFIGGSVFRKDGVEYLRIARWDGAELHHLNSGIGTSSSTYQVVRKIHIRPDGDLVVSGRLISFPGVEPTQADDYVVQWDGQDWYPLGIGLNNYANAFIELSDGRMLACGGFSRSDLRSMYAVAYWDGSDWSAAGPGIDGQVNIILQLSNGNIVVGGEFKRIADLYTNRIAVWDGSNWADMAGGVGDFDIGVTNTQAVLKILEMTNGNIVVAGDFDGAGGLFVNNLAEWDGSTWHGFGDGPSFVNIQDIALLHDGTLLACSIGGSVEAWNGSSWSPLGTGTGFWLRDLFVTPDGELIAAGGFDEVNGLPAGGIARWDGSSWTPITGSCNGHIHAVASMPNGDLVVGGSFSEIDGHQLDGIARFDGKVWHSFGSGIPTVWPNIGVVRDIAIVNSNQLVAVGDFDFAGGALVYGAAYWDGSVWLPMGRGIRHIYGAEVVKVVDSDRIIIGGIFDMVGDVVSRGLAQYGCIDTCIADTNGDGMLSPADFSAWVAAFNSQALACDQNGDGACTPADFSAWIANYNAGC